MTDHPMQRASAPRAGAKVIRDTVHGFIKVDARLVSLIDHPYVQRLRRISQTSMSALVYPTMTGNRFEHSLGAMHLAQVGLLLMWTNTSVDFRNKFRLDVANTLSEIMESAEKKEFPALIDADYSDLEFLDALSVAVGAAALLHDVGHTAYSHALERYFFSAREWICADTPEIAEAVENAVDDAHAEDRDFHEVIGLLITDDIKRELPSNLPWTAIIRILRSVQESRTWDAALHQYIAGEVDVDRIDYLLRDSKNSGTGFGSFDSSRLLDSLAIHKVDGALEIETGWVIGYQSSALPALEDFIERRYQYYRRVALHNKSFGFNRILDTCVRYLTELEKVGATVSSGTPDSLNYFPSRDASERRHLCGDDNAVVEWIKQNSRLLNMSPPADGNLAEVQRRFVALSNSILCREKNWISLWKNEYEYERIAETLYKQLKARIGNCEFQFSDALKAADVPMSSAARGREILLAIKDTYMSRSSLQPDVISIPPFGPTALLNQIGRVLLTSDVDSKTWKSREMEVADYLGSRCSDNITDIGFWVMGFYSIVPSRGGFEKDPAAQVYENNEVVYLAERSKHFVTRLSNVEAARPQFRCYFVFTTDSRVNDIDIRAEFMSNFPALVQDIVTALIVPNIER